MAVITVQHDSATTQGTKAARVKELYTYLGPGAGMNPNAASALANIIASLEVRVTELEAKLAGGGNNA
jgi:hypothetical protein